MAKLFVFGIGGTGSRVLKSLTMLLASGVDLNGYELVPIIIDPDAANGDLTRTVEMLKGYQEIRKEMDFALHPNTGFFNTPLEQISTNFRLELQDTRNEVFRDFIGFSTLSTANQALASMLFSEDNLQSDMEVGFKGNPNIGAVVLNQFNENEDFQKFAAAFSKGDRIFIISSIFGGTGAAGFPLLLKNIKNADQTLPTWALLKEAPIGALTMLPYFGVWPDEKSKIDKATFISKTKAALSYYDSNITGNRSLNALYYLGDALTKDYENHEGAVYQKNDAHFLELLGALSIVDFAATPDTALQNQEGRAINPVYKEYGLHQEAERIGFQHLGPLTSQQIQAGLSKYLFFTLYLKNHLQDALDMPWATGRVKIDRVFLSGAFYNQYLRNFNTAFLEWLTEMKRNKRSFAPFNLKVSNRNLFEVIEGLKPKKGLFERGSSYKRIDYLLSKVEPKIKAEQQAAKFMTLFDLALSQLIKEKYNFK